MRALPAEDPRAFLLLANIHHRRKCEASALPIWVEEIRPVNPLIV